MGCVLNNFLPNSASADFQILHSGVLPTVAMTSCRPIKWTEFLAIIDMFVIKLENIQVVNYVETTVEWEQWAIADSDSE